MSKRVMRFVGSLLLGILFKYEFNNFKYFVGNHLHIERSASYLYGIAEYREQKRLKEEGVPSIDERVVNKMKSYFTICMTCFVLLFIMYLCVNKYLDRQVVHVNELLYIVILVC